MTDSASPPAQRRTQIVATIGPGSRTPERLDQLIEAGMDVARLHFSYGDQPEHEENIRRLRRAARERNRPLLLLQDLGGTKLRMADFAGGTVELKKDATFTLTSSKTEGDASHVSVNLDRALAHVSEGDRVLLNDGALELKALQASPRAVQCKVLRGGTIKSRQSIHLPGKSLPLPVPTEKDLADVRFALQQGIDWIALSYASHPDELQTLRQTMREAQGRAGLMVKIERPEALENLDGLIAAADAVMAARGDLGLTTPIERIGLAQKEIIRRCNDAGKPVVTATEMLESMMEEPRPTRAEVTDITNAILDGSDAVMLSGETAVGDYPVEAVRMMARIARTVEESLIQGGTPRTFRPLQ